MILLEQEQITELKKAEVPRQKAEGFQNKIFAPPEGESVKFFQPGLDTLFPFSPGRRTKAFLLPPAFCPLPRLVKGIGIDITPIPKIARIIDRCDRETLNSLFTLNEIDYCQSTSHPHQFYALCFATKEAVGKALGTGLVGIDWNEIEANITDEKLTIHLHGKARIQSQERSIQDWFATWWHWDNHIFVHVFAY